MSTKLNKRQLLAAAMLGMGNKAKVVSKELGIRCETLSRWKQMDEFNDVMHQTHVHLYEDMINQQTFLIRKSQNIIEEALSKSSLPLQIKANLAMRFLQIYSGSSSAYEKMETHLKKTKSVGKENHDYLKVQHSIIKAFFNIRDFEKMYSGEEFRGKVIEQIGCVNKDMEEAGM